MAVMQGLVEQVSQKDVTTKFGVKPTYSMKVDGGWVKCGFKNPKADVGDEVQFNGEAGAYGMEAKDVVITAKGKGTPPAVVPSSKPSYSGGYKEKVFPIPPLHGDRSIVRQNALARAVELYIGCYGGKAFELTTDTTTTVCIALARKFEAYTAGDLDLSAAKEDIKTESKE